MKVCNQEEFTDSWLGVSFSLTHTHESTKKSMNGKTQTVGWNELLMLTAFSINNHLEGWYITVTHCTCTIPKPFPVWNNVNKDSTEFMSLGFSPATVITILFKISKYLNTHDFKGFTVGCNGTFKVFNVFLGQVVLSALSSEPLFCLLCFSSWLFEFLLASEILWWWLSLKVEYKTPFARPWFVLCINIYMMRTICWINPCRGFILVLSNTFLLQLNSTLYIPGSTHFNAIIQ